MANGWFPGIKDAAYWRAKNERKYRIEAQKARQRRIAKRPTPTEVFTATATTGIELRIGRASSKDPWYLEKINELGAVTVTECRRMSKKAAQAELEGVRQFIEAEAAEGSSQLAIIKCDFNADSLTLDEAAEELEALLAKLRPEAGLNAEILSLIPQIRRAKEILASFAK